MHLTCVHVHTSYRQEDDSRADVGACGGSSSSSTTTSTTSRTAAEDGWRQAALALASDVAEDRVVAQGFADAAGLSARKLAGDTSERMEVMEEIKAAVNRVQSSVPWMERLAIALDKAWPLEIGRPGHPDVLSRKSLLDHGVTAVGAALYFGRLCRLKREVQAFHQRVAGQQSPTSNAIEHHSHNVMHSKKARKQ